MKQPTKITTILVLMLTYLFLPIKIQGQEEVADTQSNVEYGLASAYPGDNGLINDPSVIFSSDFESQEWLAEDFGYGGVSNSTQGYRVADPGLAFQGEGVLEYQNIEGEHYPYRYQFFFEEQDQIFIRWYRRYEPGYDFSCQSKMHGVYARSEYGSSGAGVKPTGYDKFSAKIITDWEDTTRVSPIIYSYHPEQPVYANDLSYGENLQQNIADKWHLDSGEWHSYEIMIKANTAGQYNGELKMWIDGVLKAHYPGMRFRDTNDLKLTELQLGAHMGGGCTATRNQKLWDDNFVLATEYIGPMVQSQDDGIIIDDSDDGFSTDQSTSTTRAVNSSSDGWQEYTKSDGQHYGGTHYYDADAGTGQDTATWAFTVPEAGLYEVYAWWWANDWRPTDVPFTVNAGDESQTIRVNQQQNGGQWNSLGLYYFGSDGSVVISDDVSSGRDIVADAIRLVNRSEIVVDNSDPGFTTDGTQNTWQEHTQADGQHYGGTHYYDEDAGTGEDTATWSFTVPEPGLYEVYAWWWASDWRPADVPYTINSTGENETVRVNQQQDGGQWNALGTYYFDGDGSIVLSDDVTSGRDIVADAVRLVFQSTAEPSGTYLTIQTDQQEIYPGDTVTVNVAVNNAEDLYGLQVACGVDPTIFTWTGAQFDDFFTDPILGAKNLDTTAGTWTGAISQKNPAPALSGDGAFATFTFEAAAVGSTAINCDPLASDRDGVELPITVSSKTITVLDPAGDTPPGTTAEYGVVQGKVGYQGRSEHTGIEIKTIGPTSKSIQTDDTGEFAINDLPSSDYGITADAELHLPACTTNNVADGQVITLSAAVLAGGDLDDNNEIRINDATLVGSNFGLSSTSSPAMNSLADINTDGEVNIKDLSILGGNFGKSGCQEWTTDPDTSS